MRQWWVVPGGDGGTSELREVPTPAPDTGQVLIETAAAAINRGELIARVALRSDNPNARPRPSGIEVAGTITAVGARVDGWSIGDRVMARGAACHADAVVLDANALMAVPPDLDLVEAAAIPNVFVTAHDAVVTAARLNGGESVLITAGSSGVGTAAIQIAKLLDAGSIIATSRANAAAGLMDKEAALIGLGATAVVDTTAVDWATKVRGLTGGVDVVIDQVGGDLFEPALDTMAVAGRYVTVGRNGGKRAEIDLDLVARKRLELIGVTFRTRSPEEALACSTRFADDLLPAFSDGRLHPVLDRTFPLDDLPAAHDHMRSDSHIGKIVLIP